MGGRGGGGAKGGSATGPRHVAWPHVLGCGGATLRSGPRGARAKRRGICVRTSKEVGGGDQRGEGWGEEGRNEKKGDRRHDGEADAIRSREGRKKAAGGGKREGAGRRQHLTRQAART